MTTIGVYQLDKAAIAKSLIEKFRLTIRNGNFLLLGVNPIDPPLEVTDAYLKNTSVKSGSAPRLSIEFIASEMPRTINAGIYITKEGAIKIKAISGIGIRPLSKLCCVGLRNKHGDLTIEKHYNGRMLTHSTQTVNPPIHLYTTPIQCSECVHKLVCLLNPKALLLFTANEKSTKNPHNA